MPSASGGSGLMSWKACEPAWRRGWRCTISVSGSTSNLVVLGWLSLICWSGDLNSHQALKPPADSTAPTVSTVMPTGGATNVDTTTNVVASFSEAMDAASVTDPANFTLHKEVLKVACTDTVPATLSYDSANATLDPSAPLDESSTYRVTVSGAWDLAGNQLDEDPNTSGDQPKSWSFTTVGPRPGTSSSTPNVWAWGSNDYGQLGDGTRTDRTTP